MLKFVQINFKNKLFAVIIKQKPSTTFIMETIEKIKTLRQFYGLTQELFADMLCISLSAYKKIELGITKELTLPMLRDIAQILETTVAVLVDTNNDMLKPSQQEEAISKQIRKLEVKIIDLNLTILARDYTIKNLQNPTPPPEKTAQQIKFEITKAYFDRKWKELVVDVNNKKTFLSFEV